MLLAQSICSRMMKKQSQWPTTPNRSKVQRSTASLLAPRCGPQLHQDIKKRSWICHRLSRDCSIMCFIWIHLGAITRLPTQIASSSSPPWPKVSRNRDSIFGHKQDWHGSRQTQLLSRLWACVRCAVRLQQKWKNERLAARREHACQRSQDWQIDKLANFAITNIFLLLCFDGSLESHRLYWFAFSF